MKKIISTILAATFMISMTTGVAYAAVPEDKAAFFSKMNARQRSREASIFNKFSPTRGTKLVPLPGNPGWYSVFEVPAPELNYIHAIRQSNIQNSNK